MYWCDHGEAFSAPHPPTPLRLNDVPSPSLPGRHTGLLISHWDTLFWREQTGTVPGLLLSHGTPTASLFLLLLGLYLSPVPEICFLC